MISQIIFKPKLAYQIYETLLFDKTSYEAVLTYCNDNNTSELSHFSISSDFQSNGIGKKLVETVEQMARLLKFKYIYTTTHNQQLSNYYVKKKFAKVINSGFINGRLHHCLVWACG